MGTLVPIVIFIGFALGLLTRFVEIQERMNEEYK